MTLSEVMNEFKIAKNEVIELFPIIKKYNYIIELDNVSVITLGTCSEIADNQFKITINERYAKMSNVDAIHNTLVHELLHSLPDCDNHGLNWKTAVNKYNCKYNTNISRFVSKSNLGKYYKVIEDSYNYELTCEKCGKKIHRIKLTKVITDYSKYRCSYCHGKFIRTK